MFHAHGDEQAPCFAISLSTFSHSTLIENDFIIIQERNSLNDCEKFLHSIAFHEKTSYHRLVTFHVSQFSGTLPSIKTDFDIADDLFDKKKKITRKKAEENSKVVEIMKK